MVNVMVNADLSDGAQIALYTHFNSPSDSTHLPDTCLQPQRSSRIPVNSASGRPTIDCRTGGCSLHD